MNLEDISNTVDFLRINQLLDDLFDEESVQKQSLDTNFNSLKAMVDTLTTAINFL